MTPTSVSVSSAASSAWIPVDHKKNPFSIGLGCVLPSGTLTYKVQHTFDNIFDTSITPTAFDHASITGKTASFDGNYAAPVRAVRLTVTAWTSGTVTLTVVQGG